MKESLKRLLDELGVRYEDFGTSNGQSVDYPDFAKAVAEGVAKFVEWYRNYYRV